MIAASTPIFVISYNRGTMMRKAIDSYRQLSQQVEIIIHDNGSDDFETISILDFYESQGVKVKRSRKIVSAEELNLVNETIQDYFLDACHNQRYVVTDCDIDMTISRKDAINVYSNILDMFPDVSCVGPMLRIRDIPHSYPLYNHAMNRHIDQFWKHKPDFIDLMGGFVAYQRALIDTTFALHREGEAFVRLKPGIRVYEPYEAQHMDWYLTEGCGVYHKTSSNSISHWDNASEFYRLSDVPLQFSDYLSVELDSNGKLITVARPV